MLYIGHVGVHHLRQTVQIDAELCFADMEIAENRDTLAGVCQCARAELAAEAAAVCLSGYIVDVEYGKLLVYRIRMIMIRLGIDRIGIINSPDGFRPLGIFCRVNTPDVGIVNRSAFQISDKAARDIRLNLCIVQIFTADKGRGAVGVGRDQIADRAHKTVDIDNRVLFIDKAVQTVQVVFFLINFQVMIQKIHRKRLFGFAEMNGDRTCMVIVYGISVARFGIPCRKGVILNIYYLDRIARSQLYIENILAPIFVIGREHTDDIFFLITGFDQIVAVLELRVASDGQVVQIGNLGKSACRRHTDKAARITESCVGNDGIELVNMRIGDFGTVAVGDKARRDEIIRRVADVGARCRNVKAFVDTRDSAVRDVYLDALTDIQQIVCLYQSVKTEEINGQTACTDQFAGTCDSDKACRAVICRYLF